MIAIDVIASIVGIDNNIIDGVSEGADTDGVPLENIIWGILYNIEDTLVNSGFIWSRIGFDDVSLLLM
jgi:hypothetical protein